MAYSCFVVSRIGDENSDARRQADGILNEIVRPALQPFDFTVMRADEDRSPGLITVKIVRAILEADLVVADLTGLNPNVMYELAIRHAARKHVIQLCERGNDLPFDIEALDTIFYTNDLAGRAPAIQSITAAWKAVSEGRPTTNPVSLIVDLEALAASPFSGGEVIAEQLEDLRRSLAELRSDLSAQTRSSRPRAPGEHAMNLLGGLTMGDPRLEKHGITSSTLTVAGDDTVELAGIVDGVLYQETATVHNWWIQSDQRIRQLADRLVEGLLRHAGSGA